MVSSGCWLALASSVSLVVADPTGRTYSDNQKACISCDYKGTVFANCQKTKASYWWCCNTASSKPGMGAAGSTWDKCTDAKTKAVSTPPRRRAASPPRRRAVVVSLEPANSAGRTPLEWLGDTPSKALKICQGDCDNDQQCPADGLCIQRTNRRPVVPGCSVGDSSVKKDDDYCSNPDYKSFSGGVNCMDWRGKCSVIAAGAATSAAGVFHPLPVMLPVVLLGNGRYAGVTAHYYPGCMLNLKNSKLGANLYGESWASPLQASPTQRTAGSVAASNNMYCPGKTRCEHRAKGGRVSKAGYWFTQTKTTSNVAAGSTKVAEGVFCGGTCRKTTAATTTLDAGWGWENILGPAMAYAKGATVPAGYMWCPNSRAASTPPRRRAASPPRRRAASPPRRRAASPPRRRAPVACVTVAGKGDCNCPCIVPGLLYRQTVSTANAATESWVTGTTYGYGMKAHNQGKGTCATATTASKVFGQKNDWCDMKWCIVDRQKCKYKTREVGFTANRFDVFSYETAQNMVTFRGNTWIGTIKCLDRINSYCTTAVNVAMTGRASCPCVLPAQTQVQATGKPEFVQNTPYGYGCGNHDQHPDDKSTCAVSLLTAAGKADDWCASKWCIVDYANCDLHTRYVSYTGALTDRFSYETCDTNFKGNGWTGKVTCADRANSFCTAAENTLMTGQSTCPCILPAKTVKMAVGKPAFVQNTPYGYGCGHHDQYGSDCLTANDTANGLAKDWCLDKWCIVDKKNCNLKTRAVGYTLNVSDVFSYGTCDTTFKGNSWTGTLACNSNKLSFCTKTENAADSSDTQRSLVFGVAMVLALAATV